MDDRFFEAYLDRLEELRAGFKAEVANLPVGALDWVPGPEMNSAAVLLAHTTGSLRHWIGDIALGDRSGRVREREFQVKGMEAAELLQRLDAVIDYAHDNLRRLNLDDLGKMRPTGGGREVTCAWALLHALEHGYLHLGHVQITSQLWRQRRQ